MRSNTNNTNNKINNNEHAYKLYLHICKVRGYSSVNSTRYEVHLKLLTESNCIMASIEKEM